MGAILQEPVRLSYMAPELLSIDRTKIATSLTLNKAIAGATGDAVKEQKILQSLPRSADKRDDPAAPPKNNSEKVSSRQDIIRSAKRDATISEEENSDDY